MHNKIFGRKFWAGLVGILILNYMYTLYIKCSIGIIDGRVVIVYGFLNVTLVFMYIGGNVWNSWIKSKYFHPELLDKKKNNLMEEL